jgi:hypothetical protein
MAKWKYLPSIMSCIAKAVYNLPLSWSNAVVGYVTSFPSDSDALYTTRMFFGSRTGVAQALYYSLPPSPPPPLLFLLKTYMLTHRLDIL